MGMRFRMHGCGPRHSGFPEGLFAMGFGPGAGRGRERGGWAIEETTHGDYAPSPGVVYPTLTMLQDMGQIEEAKGDGARKVFAVTDEGRSHLEEKAEEVEALFDRLEALGSDQRKAGGAPIKRSVANLLSALWHRVTRGETDEQTIHDIAAILDEAAQKIERLK